jgi:hypothetical protein
MPGEVFGPLTAIIRQEHHEIVPPYLDNKYNPPGMVIGSFHPQDAGLPWNRREVQRKVHHIDSDR